MPDPTKVRGHTKKLHKRVYSVKLRKHYFTHRVVDTWNGLPEKIVSAPSTASFERRLDKFWTNQEIRYHFREPIHTTHTNNAPFGSVSGSDDRDP